MALTCYTAIHVVPSYHNICLYKCSTPLYIKRELMQVKVANADNAIDLEFLVHIT